MKEIVQLDGNGRFKLSLDYFVHHSDGVTMTWEAGEPKMGSVYSQKIEIPLGQLAP